MKRSTIQTTLMAILLLGISLATRLHAAPPPLPDFVIESLSIAPTNAVEGAPITLTVTVKNQGDAAGDGRYFDVWLNTTNCSPVFGDVGDWWTPVGLLEPGASRTIISPPVYVKSEGTNHLFACIEFEDFVSEKVNTNNCFNLNFEAEPVSTLLLPVHRFWSDQFGGHFYIMGDSERDRIAAKYPGIWQYETVAWHAFPVQVVGTEPVHRFWSDQFGKHFYIIGDSERDRIAAKYLGIWRYETVAWYAYPTQVAGTEPIGRFWSDQFMGHFYTITQPEIDRIAAKYPGIWNYETVAYWAFAPAIIEEEMNLSDAPPLTRDEVELDEAKNFTAQLQEASRSNADHTYPRSDSRGNVAPQASAGLEEEMGGFDLIYPLSYPDYVVSAHVYDLAADMWHCVLTATNSPNTAILKSVKPNQDYLLEISASRTKRDELERVHRSWFSSQFDAPAMVDDADSATALDGVGTPTVRLTTPVIDGTMTVKLYSSKLGVVQTLVDVSGDETVDLTLPEWNGWYWISGWRDADNALVMSFWLRHETEE